LFLQAKDKKKLSQASLETLSIIAYKQPLTRAEIEFIRGVNVDGAIKTLLEKGLVRISGRKEVPGRPILYSTTKDFLDHFGLGSLKDLPKLAEFSEKDIELPEHLKLKEKEDGPAAPASEPAEEAPEAGAEGEVSRQGENA
jgi:segregation and condensation protein B